MLFLFIYSNTFLVCVHVNPQRLRRSRHENFFIVDNIFLYDHYPIIDIIGNSGNLYCVSFYSNSIKCSCPDALKHNHSKQYLCKHVLFLLSLLNIKVIAGQCLIDTFQCLRSIRRMRPFKTHILNYKVNRFCLSLLYKRKHSLPINDQFSIPSSVIFLCDQCGFCTTDYSTPRGQGCCQRCGSPWNPVFSTRNGVYQNFHHLLTRYGYKLHSSPPEKCWELQQHERQVLTPRHAVMGKAEHIQVVNL